MEHKKQLNTFHLFAGAGGGILSDLLLGHNPIGACEIEEYPRNVLLARQQDGHLPEFPIWDDVCTLDGKPWRGLVDIVAGGFPCQDISSAGKGAGIKGERSGLWSEMSRIISEIRPKFVFVENSPMLTIRGLGIVLGDLAEMGYDSKWGVIGANSAGARHKRERIWIVGHATGENVEESVLVESKKTTRESGRIASYAAEKIRASRWKADEPSMVGTSHDYATWVDRSKAIGNGQVPIVAAMAWQMLTSGLDVESC